MRTRTATDGMAKKNGHQAQRSETGKQPSAWQMQEMRAAEADRKVAELQLKQVAEIEAKILAAVFEHRASRRKYEAFRGGGFRRIFRAWKKREEQRLKQLEEVVARAAEEHTRLHRLVCGEEAPTCRAFVWYELKSKPALSWGGAIWAVQEQSCTARSKPVRMHGRACWELAQTLFWEMGRFQTAKATKLLPKSPDPSTPTLGAFFCWLTDHVHLEVAEVAIWLWYRQKRDTTKPPVKESQLKSRRHYVSTAMAKHRRSLNQWKIGPRPRNVKEKP